MSRLIIFFRDTSGVILLSRNSDSARKLAALFQERQVKKKYWSVACGDGVQDNVLSVVVVGQSLLMSLQVYKVS